MTTRRGLAASIVATLACGVGVANRVDAVFLNPNGSGEALVFAYYTVNAGNSTVITLLNTSSEGKALKVRFLEGYNGRDVLDFNLYLSPFDVWVGQVVPTPGGAGLYTNDNSCTVPKLPASSSAAMAFSTQNFDGTSAQGKDGGLTDASRTREGTIEVIEMGAVTNASKGTLDAMTHISGVPQDCGQLVSAWASDGYWRLIGPAVDMAPPDGGLAGAGTIVNVPQGTVEAYAPDAIGQFYANGSSTQHSAPDALTPTLASATSLTSITYPGEVPVTATFTRGIDAVSSILMADAIENEYWTFGGVAASSEWVVSFPTKRFYTDPYYVGATAQSPFVVPFAAPGRACVPTYRTGFDREEGAPAVDVIFGIRDTGTALCQTTQVVRFNEAADTASAILGSTIGAEGVSYTYDTGFQNGWAILDLYQSDTSHLASTDGRNFLGLPATGFWVVQFVNGNVSGVLANFTAAYKHRKHVTCVTGTTQTSPGCS